MTRKFINLDWFDVDNGLMTFLRLDGITCRAFYQTDLQLLGICPLIDLPRDSDTLARLMELNMVARQYQYNIGLYDNKLTLLGSVNNQSDLDNTLRQGINLTFAVLELLNFELQATA
jgi:hypothetical protein